MCSTNSGDKFSIMSSAINKTKYIKRDKSHTV
jgi:hypothetical protein